MFTGIFIKMVANYKFSVTIQIESVKEDDKNYSVFGALCT